MVRSTFATVLALATLLVSSAALAGVPPLLSQGPDGLHVGAALGTAKAAGDTIYLMGNPRNPDQHGPGGGAPQADGTFQDAAGDPAWNGWTSHDWTRDDTTHWHVSDYLAVSGQSSYWCGAYFDGDAGYGNDWEQSIQFTHRVDDPRMASDVVWSGALQTDTELYYDGVELQWNQAGSWTTIVGFDGAQTAAFDEPFTVQPGQYVGDADDEVRLRVVFRSDGSYSDEDGYFDSDGACRLDDVRVVVDGMEVDFEDFEDQVADRWIPMSLPGVGDFAALYANLQDVDQCRQNSTPQVAFIDDGVVVPGSAAPRASPGATARAGTS